MRGIRKHLKVVTLLVGAFSVITAAIVIFNAQHGEQRVLASESEYVILSWNDIGMHFYNRDFKDLAVLPPYNNLWAQVIKVGDPPQVVTEGIEVSYSFPDNTYSVGKSNFWQYDQQLFGVDLPPNVGLTGKGLAGKMDQHADYFVAEGIPLTEFSDSDPTNPYPYQLAEVVVTETGTGIELTRATAVAPVSTEMNCADCHYDGGVEGVSMGGIETNILTLHDIKNQAQYPPDHPGALMERRPILCVECHGSNALGSPGVLGIPSLSNAIHSKHEGEISSTQDGCYKCHPGPQTQFLRGVMSTKHDMGCLDCHGDLKNVAENVNPWLHEPRCDNTACHGSAYQQDQDLYRFSREHGGIYCSACHDSSHAIAPGREENDGIKFRDLQGDYDTLRTCTVCHATTPAGSGPHNTLPTYSISGQVVDPQDNPISHVTVSAGSVRSAFTDTNGNYTIMGLSAGTYTITPSKEGYKFSPASTTVSVPQQAVVQDFIGTLSSTSEKAWTLMFYMAADNDLDNQLTTEYVTISRAGENPKISVVAFYDGLNSKARYTVFQDDGVIGPHWKGELNTGDPATLEQFVQWAQANYPAKNYALIISDHGHALGGVATDQHTNDSSKPKDDLTPKEIKQALQAIQKVDVLVMATCLMANLEVEYEIRGLADYYVASESISWGPLRHDLYSLAIDERTNPEELAIAVASAYYDEFNHSFPSTISVVKLNNVIDVATKTQALAAAIRKNWLTSSITVWQMVDASILQHFEEDLDQNITNNDRLVDLYNFAQLARDLPEQDIRNAATELIASLDNYIVYNQAWSGPFQYNGGSYAWYHQNAYGVSVALPRHPISFYTGEWLDFAGGTNWLSNNYPTNVYYESSEWGHLLVDLVDEFNPEAPDTPTPPDPVAPLTAQYTSFMPTIVR